MGPDAMILVRVGKREKPLQSIHPFNRWEHRALQRSHELLKEAQWWTAALRPWGVPSRLSPPPILPDPSLQHLSLRWKITFQLVSYIKSFLLSITKVTFLKSYSKTLHDLSWLSESWLILQHSIQSPVGHDFSPSFQSSSPPLTLLQLHLLPPQACSSHWECHIPLRLWRPR